VRPKNSATTSCVTLKLSPERASHFPGGGNAAQNQRGALPTSSPLRGGADGAPPAPIAPFGESGRGLPQSRTLSRLSRNHAVQQEETESTEAGERRKVPLGGTKRRHRMVRWRGFLCFLCCLLFSIASLRPSDPATCPPGFGLRQSSGALVTDSRWTTGEACSRSGLQARITIRRFSAR
jgi:hypothetical protein